MVERTSDALVDALRTALDGTGTVTRQPAIARRAESLLGAAVVATAPVAGGDIATATKLRLSDGTTALMKTLTGAPAGFFAAEAARAALAGRGGRRRRRCREVLAVDDECLVLRLDRARQATAAEAADLRPPARRHPRRRRRRRSAQRRGDGFIGRLPLPNRAVPTLGRVLRRAAGCCPTCAGRRPRRAHRPARSRTVEAVVGRLAELVPEEPPARLHGDLWNGNVLWGQDGRAWLVDPAAHGGHRETDLAMLALFGLPHLPRVLDAYDEATPAGRGLAGPGRRCTSCSRCWSTPACSAAGTAPARPPRPRGTPDLSGTSRG